jgi:AcrR family transcriptional regulator
LPEAGGPGRATRHCPAPTADGSHSAADGGPARAPSRRRPSGHREQKKLETRHRIFRSAFELFALRGFDGTTVEQIAKRAHVAKGTVFNYFPHKTAFLLAAHYEWMARLEDDLGPVDSWEGSARSRLDRILEHLAELSAEHRELSRMVIFESMREAHLRMGAAGAADPNQAIHPMEDLTKAVIRRGKAAGDIRPEVDDEQAASLIAATTFSTLVRWLVRGGSARDVKAALAAKLDIIFTGLAP